MGTTKAWSVRRMVGWMFGAARRVHGRPRPWERRPLSAARETEPRGSGGGADNTRFVLWREREGEGRKEGRLRD